MRAPDDHLLTRAANGDQAAFAELYDRHAETIARYLWAWFEDTGEVQDLVQEVFVTAWQKASAIKIVDSSALPWLLATAKNHARNRRRKLVRRRETSIDRSMDHISDAASANREKLQWVLAEIETLSDSDRRVVELCLIEGLSYREAAAELGQSVPTVAKRLQRAKARLREAVLTHE